MIERNSSRDPEADLILAIGSDIPAGAETAHACCRRSIDAGRMQVARAAAILECMAFTLAYHREATDREMQIEASDFTLVAEVARDLLKDCLKKLEVADICASECGEICNGSATE